MLDFSKSMELDELEIEIKELSGLTWHFVNSLALT